MDLDICHMVGIDFPLFAFSHCRDVVAAASRAGAFGVFGGSTFTPEQLKVELDWIDAHVDGRPYGVDLAIPESVLGKHESGLTARALMERIPAEHYAFANAVLARHGVPPISPDVYATHRSGSMQSPSDVIAYLADTAERLIEETFRHPIRLVVNALGRPPDLMRELARRRNVPVGALVGSLEHARRQLAAGVDVLIAQGTEAAAHCGEVSTLVLVPEVIDGIRDLRPVPVLAAGGIVTGRQMAAVMAMGAQGAWTGSVWLPTVESDVPSVVREKLLAARSADTIRSRALTGKTARQLKSAWSSAWEDGAAPGTLPMPLQGLLAGAAVAQAVKSAEAGNAAAGGVVTEGVGQGVGMLTTSKSVRTVVQEFMEDFAAALERTHRLVG